MHSEERQPVESASVVWTGMRAVWRRRRLAAAVLVLALIVSLVVSFLLPVRYKASTTVVRPGSSGDGALSALLGDVGSAAAALLGGGIGDYTRYMAILESHSMMEEMVDAFDLAAVYDLEDADNPEGRAVEVLRGFVDFRVDMGLEYLEISVLDESPRRAADMADAFVEKLNDRNAGLMSAHARSLRTYIERQVHAADSALAAARDSMRVFQNRHGIIELESQTRAYLEMVAGYRSEALLSEISYEALKLDYGEENPQVRDAYQRVRAARAIERRLAAGADDLMPVSMDSLPDVARRYAEHLQDVLVESAVVEVARPLLEQARYDELRQTTAVQVLDSARVPVLRAQPRRTRIVLSTVLSALLLVFGYSLPADWWNRRHTDIIGRLNEALDRS